MLDITRVYYTNGGIYDSWDCNTTLSKDKVYSLMLAIIKFNGTINSTLSMGGGFKQLSRVEVFMRITLPTCAKEDFEEFSGLRLTKPPKVQAN